MTRMSDMGRAFAALALAAIPLTLSGQVGRLRQNPVRPPDSMGLTVADGRRNGPVVTSLRSGGPAERGGIAVGDEVHAIDGHRTHGASAVRRDLRDAHHCRVAIDLRRGGHRLVATVGRCDRTAH